MNLTFQIPSLTLQRENVQETKESIRLKIFSDPYSPELVVNNLAAIEGPLDIYFWYEGSRCLPKAGANFMKSSIFQPLYQLKQDVKLYPYSLRAWDFKANTANMPSSTPLGEAINRINTTAIECIYSSSFFQFCTEIQEVNDLYEFLSEELPKKKWLFTLSERQRKKNMTVTELFNEKVSLFECIKDLDVSAAYSLMQYVEGYYLIRESVRKALLNEQTKVQIAFVLPNDESKYYIDYPKDIAKMLRNDFGEKLSNIEIDITFQFFEYGNSLAARPYIDKPKAPTVAADDICFYFDYLQMRYV